MDEINRERQRMLERGNLSYIQPARNVDDETRKIIVHTFGSIFLNFKPVNMLWYQYYIFLYTYYQDALNGKKHYWDSDIQQSEVLKLLYSEIPRTWLEKYSQRTDSSGADFALSQSNFEVVDWLASQQIYPTLRGLREAVEMGVPSIFSYMMDQQIDETFTLNMIIIALQNGYRNFLDIVPIDYVHDALELSLESKDISKFELFMNYPILHYIGIKGNSDDEIIQNYIDSVANPDSLSFLLEKGFRPGIEVANKAVMDRDLILLRLLVSYGIYPTEGTLDRSIKRGRNLSVLQLLSTYDILPSIEGANNALRKGDLATLRFLLEHGIYPNIKIIRSKKNVVTTEMTELLAQYGIFPSMKK
jgi:hypothetical protein